MRARDRVIAAFAVVVTSTGLASIAMDEFAPAYNGAPDSAGAGRVKCKYDCPNGTVEYGHCYNNQTCCGWYNCTNGTSQLACCSSGQTCKNGLHSDPPSQPVCETNP